ncbi:MAG: pantoate kinase [Candidatus Hodarchaeales archaeon]
MASKYWAAGHITAFFEIADSASSPLEKGSRGAGFCINRGVMTEVEVNTKKTHQIFFNNKKQPPGLALVSENILKIMKENISIRKLDLRHTFEVPMGSGFGASAAGALSTVFAIRDTLDLDYSDLDLWQIAHTAEIYSQSGLGDILGLYTGGFEFREIPGAPGIGKTKKIKGFTDDYKIMTISLGPLSTKMILTDPKLRKKINSIGYDTIEQFKQYLTFQSFLEYANDFTNKVELISDELKTILTKLHNLKSVHGAQIMLGDGLFLFYLDNNEISFLLSIPRIKENMEHYNIVEQTLKQID